MRDCYFYLSLGIICSVLLTMSCKSSKSISPSIDCVEGYFVADLRGKVSPSILEYAKQKYGVSFQQLLDNTTNTSLYVFDTSKISLEELLIMMNESEFCESATCYSNSNNK